MVKLGANGSFSVSGGVVSRLGLVVWLSGNALVVINEVTLRQARLILGWVTDCGQVNHLGM